MTAQPAATLSRDRTLDARSAVPAVPPSGDLETPTNLGQALWADAICAAACLAVDPFGLGGLVVRAQAGPVRDRFVAAFEQIAVCDRPLRKIPPHCPEDRLLGGLDVSATLSLGRPVTQRGVLSEADGGFVTVPMAERADAGLLSTLSTALDRGEVDLQRDGLSMRLPSKISVMALDEGVDADDRVSQALSDRLAFVCDLSHLSIHDWSDELPPPLDIREARRRIGVIELSDACLAELAALAAAFGVASPRALLHAARCTLALAALNGRDEPTKDDIATAARLVIAPRATQLPVSEQEAIDEEPPQPEDQDADPPPDTEQDNPQDQDLDRKLDDEIVEAVEAAIPQDLLARLKLGLGGTPSSSTTSASGEGGEKAALQRGRPLSSRRGKLDGRQRLHLVDTLRAAAPWQTLRRQEAERLKRIHIGADDIRIRRYKRKEESLTIFVVDASGSSALHRLAEVKGAVELLLAQSYARRDYVALIAFRESSAELVLPPTRSLLRAKRCLSSLPGGGGTPLALGIEAAVSLAVDSQRLGRAPRIVFLTDCKANIGFNSKPGRAEAMADAEAAATRLASYGLAALLIDTSPRRNPKSQELAAKMAALHMPLPYPSAEGIQAVVLAGQTHAKPSRSVRSVGV